MPKKHLPPFEVAEQLGVPVATLVDWRYKKKGPRFIKVGRLVRYAQEDIDAYVDAQRVETANA